MESGGRDPLSGKPYTYYLYSSKKHFQLLGMFEKEGYQERLALGESNHPLVSLPEVESVSAAENTDLFPVTIGTELGVVLDTSTNTPMNEMGTGTVTLSQLVASGATVVGSPITSTGSSVVLTSAMLSALSTPLTTNGALVISLQEQFFGSGSAYTTGWSSNPCDVNAISVVEVNPGNYLNHFPASLTTNTIYSLSPDDYPIVVWTNISLPSCSAIISASQTNKARIWSGHPTNYSSSGNGAASPVCGSNFITT
jgi:hypothetical protein